VTGTALPIVTYVPDTHHDVNSTTIMIILNHARFSGKTLHGDLDMDRIMAGHFNWRETLACVGNELRRDEGEVTIPSLHWSYCANA